MMRLHAPALLAGAMLLAAPPVQAAANRPVEAPDHHLRDVPYKRGNAKFEGKLVLPPSPPGPLPLVVLFPDWMGVTQRTIDDARRIATMGYAVFVADPYGKEARPKDAREAARLAGALRTDVLRMREIGDVALRAGRRQEGVDSARVALVGYCFGGNMALETARSGIPVRGVASIHGNLRTPFPDDARNIRGRVLVLHGAADPHVPPDEVKAFQEEMTSASVTGSRLRFVEYPGAMHAFTNPDANAPENGAMYHPEATEAAYRELEKFLGEVFGE